MPDAERYDAVVIGSGEGGKYLAWHLAQAQQKTAVVERRWVGGSCPRDAILTHPTMAEGLNALFGNVPAGGR